MVSISRNTVAYALINFAFWGFLGAQAFSTPMHGMYVAMTSYHIPIAYLGINSAAVQGILAGSVHHAFDTVTILGMIPGIFKTIVFFLLGWGISKIFTNRNVMIAIAGFGAAALNIYMVVSAVAYNTTSVEFTIIQDVATILLYMGLCQWMMSNVEYKSNPYQSLALSGWGGILIVVIMGALFDAHTMFAGIDSFRWAFIFSYCVLTMFGIGGLLLTKKENAKAEAHAQTVAAVKH